MLYLPYGLSDPCSQYKHESNNSKNIKVTFLFLPPTHLYFYSFPLLPYLFHPTYLPSVCAQYFSPVLSLPLSHFVASVPHVLDRLSPLCTSCTFSPPLPSNTCSLQWRLVRGGRVGSAQPKPNDIFFLNLCILIFKFTNYLIDDLLLESKCFYRYIKTFPRQIFVRVDMSSLRGVR
jgi:hypothetical protein